MGHHNPQHGKLGIIDPEAGRDENEGVMFVAPVRKPEAERIDSYGQFTDQFQHPFPLNETEFLISYTPLGYYVGHPMMFGIYWMIVLNDDSLEASGESGTTGGMVVLLTLVTCGIYGIYWSYQLGQRIDRINTSYGRYTDNSGLLYLLLNLFGLAIVVYAVAQNELNQYYTGFRESGY